MRAFRVAYDGRRFHGFQRQPGVPTVAGAILDALGELGVLGGDGADRPPATDAGTLPTPPGYAAAGRTDAGVSARGQVVAFDAPDWLTPRAFNGTLPPAVRAWAAADVPAGFHATHDAVRREYVYFLVAPGAEESGDGSTASPAVDDDRIREALARLSGRHDFHNLTPDATGTERELDASATRTGDVLRLRAAADGFPREFVRRLATLVRAVGTGDASLATVDRVLSEETLSGPEGVGPAPPEPLVLWDVDYPDASFAVDGEAAASAREVFGEAHASAAARERVTDALRRVGDDGAP